MGNPSKYKIAIVGSGRLARQLANAFFSAGIVVSQIYARNSGMAQRIANQIGAQAVNDIHAIKTDTTCCVLAVSDDAIAAVSEALPSIEGLVVHTSGFRGFQEIHSKHAHRGVFYPLQTFTHGRDADFHSIPFFVEAEHDADQSFLLELGNKLSDKVMVSRLFERQRLHLAAVFVSNFTNALYVIGKDLLEAENLDFSLLHPLILETASKAIALNPHEGQTGPARRNDAGTIREHVKMLYKNQEAAEVYKLFTSIIQNKYKNQKDE